MKTLKIFLWASGVLLALTIGAVVVLTTLVDPNDYKPKIAAQVKEHTGRELNLEGDIELAFFPWLGVKTGRAELSNGEGFGAKPMLSVEQAVIKIKLLPLLKKRMEVATVLLHKPRIRLARRADGVTNWDDLIAKARPGGDAAHDQSPPDAALLAGLAVQGVSIQDGWVDWEDWEDREDRAAGQTLTLSALNLNTGTLAPGKPLDVNLSFDAEGNMLPERAAVTLTTTARLAENVESVSLHNTRLQVNMENATADFSVGKISYALRAGLAVLVGLRGAANHGEVRTTLEIPSLNFNRADESLQLPQINLEQGDFFFAGSANSAGVLSGIPALTASGDVDARIEDVKGFLARNDFTAVLPPGLANAVDVGFRFNVADNRLVLNDLTIASLEEPGGKLLVNQKKVVIPLKADGTPDYGRALGGWLRAEMKRKINQWLEPNAPDDNGKTEAQGGDLEALKEKLKKGLRKVLGRE